MKWYSPSALALIIANLVPLYGVVYWGWSVLALLALFWLEIMLVGSLTVLRMLLANPSDASLWVRKIVVVPCFCILYGIFVVGLGIMMYKVFGDLEGIMPFEDGLLPVGQTIRVIEEYGLRTALAAFGVSHVFSFFWNYLGHGEFRHAALKDLMWEGNSRVYIFFFSLFFGALFMALGSPVWGLAILVGFKIWLDLDDHLKAHGQAEQVAPASITFGRIGLWFQKNPEKIPLGIGVLCLLGAAALLVNTLRYLVDKPAIVTVDSFWGLFGGSLMLGLIGAMAMFFWRLWRSERSQNSSPAQSE